ncbi:CNH domain-containing protein [Dichotomocladium elegans]|nr:CNH domain-containing protein [Dichotomocladium elegans]
MSFEANANYSILSELSLAFKTRMKRITNVREVKSSNEYPESFSGQEAITLLQEILIDKGIPEGFCVLVANALMNSTPPLFEPIRQNYKSLITNEVYNSSDQFYTFDEDLSENDLPIGVFTLLTKCYVDGCLPGQGGCYAPRCPNRPDVFDKDIMSCSELGRRSSVKSTASLDDTRTMPPTAAWAQRVPKEVLESTPKRERERQEAINEMIYSEEVYLRDLQTLNEVFIQPLWRSNVIPEKKRGAFIKRVFSNIETLTELSSTLSKKLLDIQRKYDGKCVPGIGDILVDEFKYYSDPYTTYTPNVPLAEYYVNQEKSMNPEFARFMSESEKDDRMRRLAFRHFLMSPVTRMQRYPLLLHAIIKKTDEGNIDRKYLVNCKEVIHNIAMRSDMQTAYTKQRVEILKINDMISTKPGESHDLELTEPNRRLYYRGDLKRRGQGIEVTEKSDIHAFVFDHRFVMTKQQRKGNNGDDFRLWKTPIELQLLFVLGGNDYQGSMSSIPNGGSTSLTLQHLGQRDGLYQFFCNSLEEKQQWIRAIEEAKAALKRKRQGDYDVFELRTIDDSFRYYGSGGPQARISCTVPFVSRSGEQKIVIGTDSGVYIKAEGNSSSVRRVLALENVTQAAVMERHHILLVLADKVLRAYSIDALDSPSKSQTPDRSYEVGQGISFFQVGMWNNRSLCVVKNRKGFLALEPVCDMRDPKSERLFTPRSKLLGRASVPAWFSTYTPFYVGAEATNVHFLKSRLSIVVESQGFEVIDLDNLVVGGRNIPDQSDPQFGFVQRNRESLKPLVMYRIADKFLLCYNRFAFYVNNRNGSLVARGSDKQDPWLCKWHGTPDNIVYHHPYILAVNQQFIEVRSVETGELIEIIKGSNLRVTYYSGGGEAPVIHCCMAHPQRPDTQLLFQLCLSNVPNNRSNSSRRPGY